MLENRKDYPLKQYDNASIEQHKKMYKKLNVCF